MAVPRYSNGPRGGGLTAIGVHKPWDWAVPQLSHSLRTSEVQRMARWRSSPDRACRCGCGTTGPEVLTEGHAAGWVLRHYRVPQPGDREYTPVVPVPRWSARPACAEADPDLFFRPDRGGIGNGEEPQERHDREGEAKEFCAGCPVDRECLAFALKYRLTGVWGGTNDEERRRLVPRPPCRECGVRPRTAQRATCQECRTRQAREERGGS